MLNKQPRIKRNINSLSVAERKEDARLLYDRPSYFMKQFGCDRIEFDISHVSALLRKNIERLLIKKKIITQAVELEYLHEIIPENLKGYNFNDGVNQLSSFFYETDEIFLQAYYQFVYFIFKNIIKENFWFQATPTIRIHCPNAVNGDLYPRYHTDICYGHPPEEINIWLPLTNAALGHGFNVMSLAYSKKVIAKFDYDYPLFIKNATDDREFSAYCDSLADPVTTELGKLIMFDSRCVHSAIQVKQTRISIDIRILPTHLYEEMDFEYEGLGRRKILFAPGHCYHTKSIEHLL